MLKNGEGSGTLDGLKLLRNHVHVKTLYKNSHKFALDEFFSITGIFEFFGKKKTVGQFSDFWVDFCVF